MRYEDFIAEQEAEKQSRIEGSTKISGFIKHLVGETYDPSDPSTFANAFKGMNFEQFKGSLETLNGILKQIPRSERGMLEKSANVIEGGDKDWINLQPVKRETGKELLKSTFETMQTQAKENDPRFIQRLAITLYNSIIYLHAFPDGNGRTARLVYFLLSPDVEKTRETFDEHLGQILNDRPREIKDYHDMLNYGYYLLLLQNRGIPQEYDEEEKDYCASLTSDTFGFDMWKLGYLAAHDTLTEEEKKQNSHMCKHGNVPQYKLEDFTPEIQKRFRVTHEKVREEFTNGILEMSETYNEWPDYVISHLNKALEYKPAEEQVETT